MVVSDVGSFSCKRSSTMSPSMKPSIIWSYMFFCVHSSVQNLHVLASSQRVTRKLSNDSPGCWAYQRKFQHSTDSIICPSTYHCMALTISWILPLWVSVRPRFSTIVSVSREKHSVRALACFACVCLSSLDKLRCASHCVFLALNLLVEFWHVSLLENLCHIDFCAPFCLLMTICWMKLAFLDGLIPVYSATCM